jgi:hypothetical protein
MRRNRSWPFMFVIVALAGLSASCGGGGSTGGNMPPPGNPSFTMTVSPSSVTLAPGSSTTLQIVVSATDGFNDSIQVSVSGNPSGVTVSPSSPFTIPSTGGFVTVTIGASVALSKYSLEFQGNGGTVTQSASANLNVTNPTQSFPPGGSSFIPMDQQPYAAVFDPVHNLVFASLPWIDMVEVVSTTSHQLIKSIPVPGPEGLDLTLDDSQVLVGTTTNQFFTIDTRQLAVVGRTTIPPVNTGLPQYIQPHWAVATANGKILIIGTGDFPVAIFEWNPQTKQLTPCPNAGVGNTARASKTPDGSKVLLWDPQGGASIYNAASDSFAPVQTASAGPGAFPSGAAINPSGTQVAVAILLGPVIVADGNGNMIQQLDGPPSFGLLYTADGKDLVSLGLTSSTFELITLDAISFQSVGTAPVFASNTLGGTRDLPWNPDLQPAMPFAMDDKGFIYGGADHGLSIDSATNFQSLPASAFVPVFVRWVPSEGPLNTPTSVTLNVGVSAGLGMTFLSPNIFIGSQTATNTTVPEPFELLFTAPGTSVTGPQTVEIQQSDGTTSYLPLAFAYGSVLYPQPIQALPPDGGVTADLFGYGLGVDVPTFGTTVRFGGQSAPITFDTIGINVANSGGETYPFPIQHLQVTAPAGSPGPADVLVTSPTGAVTGAGAVRYMKSVTVARSSDTLSALAYDQTRQRVYLSAGNHVDVFDLASSAFVSPISLPSLHGTSMAAGLTLTPDGSKLLVSNSGDSSIAVINPDSPSGAVAVNIPFAPLPPGTQCMQNPGQIVAINTGLAYASIFESGVESCPTVGVVELDIAALTSRVITSTSDPTNPLGYLSGLLMATSRDGATLAVTDFNNLYLLNAATGVWQMRQLDSNSNLHDIAVSSDGSLTALRTFSGSIDIGFAFDDDPRDRYIAVDPDENVTASLVSSQLLNFFSGNSVPGMQLHDSGSLIYATQVQQVDLFDLRNGQERERVLLPEPLVTQTAVTLPQTAIDKTGSQIFLITQSGLTVVTLDSVPLSIARATPAAGTSSGGVQVTIRGSGFDANTTVTFGGAPATATFVDSNTIQIETPATAKGAVQATVQTQDGRSYTLDDAYEAN